MAGLFIFGIGYSGSYIAAAFRGAGWQVVGTGRGGEIDFADDKAVRQALAASEYVLSCAPPQGDDDSVLARYGDQLQGKWLGYLSSTGVYGDCAGGWVDETRAADRGRRPARIAADSQWLALGAFVFRLPGIYGPGRSALNRVKAGKAMRIAVPEQVFSRIYVSDIARAVLAAANHPNARPGAYNIADNLPASQNAVIEEACRLLGQEPPEMVTLDNADLSEAARAFYAENRRIANNKARRLLGWQPEYPDYVSGLAAAFAADAAARAALP